MLAQHPPYRAINALHGGRIERFVAVNRRVSRSDKDRIALAQRNLQSVGDVDDHLSARRRSAGLNEAHMFLRDTCVQGEFQLRLAPDFSPMAQLRAGCRGMRGPQGRKSSGHGVRMNRSGRAGRQGGLAHSISGFHPRICIKRGLQNWTGDAAGIISDRRGGDNGDHLEEFVLAETGLKKRVFVRFR